MKSNRPITKALVLFQVVACTTILPQSRPSSAPKEKTTDQNDDKQFEEEIKDLNWWQKWRLRSLRADLKALQIRTETESQIINEELNLVEQRDKLNSKLNGQSSTFAIHPGVMYLAGFGTNDYIGAAELDAFGSVQVTESLKRVTRIFPSVSFIQRTSPGWPDWGVTLGVNEGVTNNGRGYAIAAGILLGVASEFGHWGIFLGGILDPTVKRLPTYLQEGQVHPFINHLNGNKLPGSPEALIANKSIDIPLRSFQAGYTAIGIVWSAKVDFSSNKPSGDTEGEPKKTPKTSGA